jgi:hypothetical protein
MQGEVFAVTRRRACLAPATGRAQVGLHDATASRTAERGLVGIPEVRQVERLFGDPVTDRCGKRFVHPIAPPSASRQMGKIGA